jgi:hypothetical protein
MLARISTAAQGLRSLSAHRVSPPSRTQRRSAQPSEQISALLISKMAEAPIRRKIAEHQRQTWPLEICPVCKCEFRVRPKLKEKGGSCCSLRCSGTRTVQMRGLRKIGLQAPLWLSKLYAQAYNQAKKGAKTRKRKRGIEFSLTVPEYNQLIDRCANRCEVTGRPFTDTDAVEAYHRKPYRPSLDRIDAEGPYSFGNCRLVSISANLGMSTWGESTYRDNAFALVQQTHKLVLKTAAEILADKSIAAIEIVAVSDLNNQASAASETLTESAAEGLETYLQGWSKCTTKLLRETTKLARCIALANLSPLEFPQVPAPAPVGAAFQEGWKVRAEAHHTALSTLETQLDLSVSRTGTRFSWRHDRLSTRILELIPSDQPPQQHPGASSQPILKNA